MFWGKELMKRLTINLMYILTQTRVKNLTPDTPHILYPTLYYNDVDEVKILRSINQHVNLLTNICIFYLIASPNQELSARIEINCKFHTGLFKPARSAHTSEPSPVK